VSGKRAFEEQLAALEALRNSPEEIRADALRKALTNRNNFVVARAADLVRDLNLTTLTDNLLAAFSRFFERSEKNDPQCWAKNAISRALANLEYQEPEVFLRGMHHIQMEPVWGGQSDTAGTLRSTCALALVQCRGLSQTALLSHLVELFADNETTVRVDALRAVAQVGSAAAALILRARAVLAKDEPEVLGVCYRGVLNIEGVSAIPWVSRCLVAADETGGEAALAIAATHSVAGFECLKQQFETAADPWWRTVLLSAIALCRQEKALKFLFRLVETESLQAESAIEAILRSCPSTETVQCLENIVSPSPRLARVFNQHRTD
jgi:hypothetical protein